MDNYLTVKEFAAAANVTTQRIYKLYAMGCTTKCNGIATELHEYFKIENGKKYIHRDALRLFENATELHNEMQPLATDNATELQSDNQALTNTLQETITALREQLTEKDKQIAELTAALKTSQQQLTVAQEQQTALTTALTQQQALHAGTIQQQLEQRSDVPEHEEPQQQQGTFFSRLFSRLKKKSWQTYSLDSATQYLFCTQLIKPYTKQDAPQRKGNP